MAIGFQEGGLGQGMQWSAMWLFDEHGTAEKIATIPPYSHMLRRFVRRPRYVEAAHKNYAKHLTIEYFIQE